MPSQAKAGLTLVAALAAGFVGGALATRSWNTLPAENMFVGCMIQHMRGQPSTMQTLVEAHCTATHGPPR